MKLTGCKRPQMPPGIAALARPRCHHPAANGFARVAPCVKLIPQSCLPCRCQPQHSSCCLKPCHGPSFQPAPGSGMWKVVAVPPSARAATHQHSLALPPSLTKPAASEPCRGVWPRPSQTLQLCPHPLASHMGCPLCTPLGANAGSGDPLPRTPGQGEAGRGEPVGRMEASSNCLLNYSGTVLTYK